MGCISILVMREKIKQNKRKKKKKKGLNQNPQIIGEAVISLQEIGQDRTGEISSASQERLTG